MKYASRGHALGFANRTRKNLEHIETAFANGADVHVITQFVNSLLGLIVFPWEKHFVDSIQTKRLVDLQKHGWPEWTVTHGSSETLGELIKNLRHSVAHGNIRFSSESRNSDEVDIEVENYQPPQYKQLKWSAKISAKHLREFCLRFINQGMFRGTNYAEKVDSGFEPVLPGFCRENAQESGSDFLETTCLGAAL